MASQTFGDVWRKVALYVPGAPVSLVQDWVQSAYDDLAGKRHWVWLRREAILIVLASRSLTVTFTAGSTAITSAGGFVVATDPGRQIRVGTGLIYTIASVADVNTATLTLAYAGTSGAQTASIHDRYLVMPADFRSFESVTDPTNSRPIAWWIAGDRLNLFDPARISSDSRFRALAAAQTSQVPSLLGRVLYEMWPAPTAAGTYQMRYFIRTDALGDDDLFQGVLATYTTALQQGALAAAARWPGTAERKNPYFNLPLSTLLMKEFDDACQQLDIMDDDQYVMDLQQVDLSAYGLGALSGDTTLLRSSDATLSDYY